MSVNAAAHLMTAMLCAELEIDESTEKLIRLGVVSRSVEEQPYGFDPGLVDEVALPAHILEAACAAAWIRSQHPATMRGRKQARAELARLAEHRLDPVVGEAMLLILDRLDRVALS